MAKGKKYRSAGELQSASAAFLQNAPLYQAFTYEASQWSVLPASISHDCPSCGKETSWKRTDITRIGGQDYLSAVTFECLLCTSARVTFAINDATELRKFGQYPAWSIALSSKIARALPEEAIPFYKKGVICLSQNFGLGAVAYFRRTVEQVVDQLLYLVEQGASLDPSNRDEALLVSLEDARRSHQASERLKLIAPHLPAHLRVGGANPLARLYEKYSEGVHVLSDEASIDVSVEMRAVLDYVLPALTEQLAAAKLYIKTMENARRNPRVMSSPDATSADSSSADEGPAEKV